MSTAEHYYHGCRVSVVFRGVGRKGEFATMELCYMVSISTLQQVLQSHAEAGTSYSLLPHDDTVTVVHHGPTGLIDQFAFPVVHTIPDVPVEEGTMMLLVATERSREVASFWVPLESKLLHCCSTTPLA